MVLFQSKHSMYLTMSNLSINLVIHRSGFFLTFQRPDKKRRCFKVRAEKNVIQSLAYCINPHYVLRLTCGRKKGTRSKFHGILSYKPHIQFYLRRQAKIIKAQQAINSPTEAIFQIVFSLDWMSSTQSADSSRDIHSTLYLETANIPIFQIIVINE